MIGKILSGGIMMEQLQNGNIPVLDRSPIEEILKGSGIVAVLEIEDSRKAPYVSEALLKGGINAIELAIRTPEAIKAMKLINKETPEMKIGAGTIIFPDQVKMVSDAGASFAVAPGTNEAVIKTAIENRLPFAPGISCASDIEKAISLGCSFLKLFPAETLGGIEYFKSLTYPYAYLNLKFLPLGGVNPSNLSKWAALPSIYAVGGSWIAKKATINAEEYQVITRNSKEAIRIWKNAKGEAI